MFFNKKLSQITIEARHCLKSSTNSDFPSESSSDRLAILINVTIRHQLFFLNQSLIFELGLLPSSPIR
jgi:hypothetical protein